MELTVPFVDADHLDHDIVRSGGLEDGAFSHATQGSLP
jgi:hypothetical protein